MDFSPQIVALGVGNFPVWKTRYLRKKTNSCFDNAILALFVFESHCYNSWLRYQYLIIPIILIVHRRKGPNPFCTMIKPLLLLRSRWSGDIAFSCMEYLNYFVALFYPGMSFPKWRFYLSVKIMATYVGLPTSEENYVCLEVYILKKLNDTFFLNSSEFSVDIEIIIKKIFFISNTCLRLKLYSQGYITLTGYCKCNSEYAFYTFFSLVFQSSKPLMEKKRRARINECLGQLKSLVLEALKKDVRTTFHVSPSQRWDFNWQGIPQIHAA